MSIGKFAKKNFKADMKNSKFYIWLVAILTAIIFNAVNLSYNDNIYSQSKDVYSVISENAVGQKVIFTYPVSMMQEENILITIGIATLFLVICNMNFINRKCKEIAFIICNGASVLEVVKYLVYINAKIITIGSLIGGVIGLIFIPIVNMIMYCFIGKDGPIFYLSLKGIPVTLVYIVVQYLTLLILNFGYICRKEIIELLKVEKSKREGDKRVFKIPGVVYLVVYLIPIIFNLFIPKFKGSENLTYCLFFVGLIGIIGVVRYFIPNAVEKLKRRKFMYSGTTRIYVSNFVSTLKESLIYLLALAFSLHYFTYAIVDFAGLDGLQENSLFCTLAVSTIIASALLYRIVSDNSKKKELYYQLKLLGYSKDEIINILNKETLLLFGIIISIPLLLVVSSLVGYLMSGVYTLGITIITVLMSIIPFIIIGFISVILNKKVIIENLFKEKSKLAI